jgi:4-deoxy-L-threo-5-hexosulose-uronate ketol-isomerase
MIHTTTGESGDPRGATSGPGMALRPSTDRQGLRGMTAQDIRDTFVIGDLFQPGQVSMTYVEVDRAVVGSAAPLEAPLPLPTDRRLASAYFCERREVGVINIGGSGWIELDGERHALARHDSLYIGRGVRGRDLRQCLDRSAGQVLLRQLSGPRRPSQPLVRRDEARTIQAGDRRPPTAGSIRQAIRPGIVETCQLVMGFTELETATSGTPCRRTPIGGAARSTCISTSPRPGSCT